MMKAILASAAAIATMATAGFYVARAQDAGHADKDKLEKAYSRAYSPYAQRDYPTRPLFGDTHLHTMASFDAGAFGARLTPRDAYRFAHGDEVVSSTGIPVRLSRPLDFLVVADHSDNMGMFGDLLAGKPNILADPQGKSWYDAIKAGKGAEVALDIIRAFSSGAMPKALVYLPGNPGYTSAWHDTIAAAEEYNSPGRFTAFIGYEWTSNTDGNNLHRNVIFRDNGDKARQVEPFVTMKPVGSDNPRDLWKWMEAYEGKTGGRVLAIPHNGNLSNGRMFPLIDSFSGQPVDKGYATARERWERLVEATQTKGDGEAHPYLSPNDEFADFETWDKGNLTLTEAKTKQMIEFEYVRSALKNGLKLERLLGINPFKFGLVGSSDAHTALAAVEEDNFMGKVVSSEPSAERISAVFATDPKSGRMIMDWEVSASGYAAVWAKDNTRASIWDAMHRRETYATTGTRLAVRFFGGWDFTAADAKSRLPAEVGYKKGVPITVTVHQIQPWIQRKEPPLSYRGERHLHRWLA